MPNPTAPERMVDQRGRPSYSRTVHSKQILVESEHDIAVNMVDSLSSPWQQKRTMNL
jgi:hypothetical protein